MYWFYTFDGWTIRYGVGWLEAIRDIVGVARYEPFPLCHDDWDY